MLADMEAFVASHGSGEVAAPGCESACAHIGKTLARFAYWKQGEATNGLLRRCLLLTTRLSESHLTRLVELYLKEGVVENRRQARRGASGADGSLR